jgi:hypothetical protein
MGTECSIRWRDETRMKKKTGKAHMKKWRPSCGLDLSLSSGYRPLAASCEHGDESSGSKQCWEYLEGPSDWRHQKKDLAMKFCNSCVNINRLSKTYRITELNSFYEIWVINAGHLQRRFSQKTACSELITATISVWNVKGTMLLQFCI